ncbi:MAG: Gfo/Idh/MocA family oxidoreductase [Bryobacteraceae bacterium]|nr:Gfo/Idh/MocA family oxidoreductase [Bryobacteraceae bacterium]
MKLALLGCGALSELYYSPALREVGLVENLQVSALIDPNPSRLDVLARSFPKARRLASMTDLSRGEVDLAIVASPPKFHSEQTIALLRLGIHVLCEKPMASSVAEAWAMVDTASKAGRLLSVGLFRRFFPSSQFVHDLITGGALGRPVSFRWMEGGPFNWPATSASFFQKAASPGGVFGDIGPHVLDLLLFWFGEPCSIDYEDDAVGGLEANARLDLAFENGVTGTLRLSRDTAIPNGTRIYFERGSVWFQGASADSVVVQLDGCSHVAKATLHAPPRADSSLDAGSGTPGLTYAQSFMEQIRNVYRAIRGEEPLRVPAEQAVRSLGLIERCYASRRLMPMPWLTEAEREGAMRLTDGAPHPAL